MSDIFNIIFASIGMILTVFAVIFMKFRLDSEQNAKLMNWIKVFVAAAEQIYGAGEGENKLIYVQNQLESIGVKTDAVETEKAMRAMIESAVLELKNKYF